MAIDHKRNVTFLLAPTVSVLCKGLYIASDKPQT